MTSTANQTATSLSIIVSGACIYDYSVDGGATWESRTLTEPGDFFMWAPGVLHALEVPESCDMVVVRWPSGDKKDHGPIPPRMRRGHGAA